MSRSLELAGSGEAVGDGHEERADAGIGGKQPTKCVEVMSDLRAVECDILTLGQYLQPSKGHLPVDRYVHPEEFAMLKERGIVNGVPARGVRSAGPELLSRRVHISQRERY